jgi:hypothetical protein
MRMKMEGKARMNQIDPLLRAATGQNSEKAQNLPPFEGAGNAA